MSDKKVIAECSFREFYFSPFADQFVQRENGNYVFGAAGAKMVELPSEGSIYDNDTIFVFYRKSPQRWVKKLEVSDQQMAADCNVSLMGDGQTGDPESIIFDVGYSLFEFVLTDEMIKELRFAEQEKFIDEYFPGWNNYSYYPEV